VKRVLDAMLINHEVDKRVLTDEEKIIEKDGEKPKARGHAARGQLHEETYYGRRKAPKQEKHSFHIRKSLSAVTENEINNIVDERVRVLVKEALGIYGDNPVPKKHLDKHRNKLVGFDEEQQKPVTHVHLPNKNGDPIPVFKVRIAKASSNAVQLKDEVNRWVEPGNNHHVAIYKDAEGKLHEQVVTFWEAVEREKQGLPAIAPHDEQGRPLEVSLQANELFLLDYPDATINWTDNTELSKYLYRAQALSKKDYEFWHHVAATKDVPHQKIRITSLKALKKRKLLKVKMDGNFQLKPA
jgi:CRISPR-associated endonuclease Csn1